MTTDKSEVHTFWNKHSCGEELYLASEEKDGYQKQLEIRYELEPFIPTFAEFDRWRDADVLEVGVGLGADHQSFAEAGARLSGIDLTERAVSHTRRRLKIIGRESYLQVADAERLPFDENTQVAIDEVWRVLRPGGSARVMIYNKYSMIGFMLWLRYGLMRLQPWVSLEYLYSKYLESPGTKAYTYSGARKLFHRYQSVEIDSVLTHGDLLSSSAGQRHQGAVLSIAKRIWPRRSIKWLFPKNGLFLMIKAEKPMLEMPIQIPTAPGQ
jgi:SAM-dependent methyltransferase